MAIDTVKSSAAAMPDTQRKDNWRAQPLAAAVALLGFIAYSSWRVFENQFYDTTRAAANAAGAVIPHYLSPFYAIPTPETDFFTHGGLAATFVSAFIALVIPVSFRASCYFCRRTFYRALFGDPSACAVKEVMARKSYTGERHLPFSLFNLHRYAFYAVLVLVVLHWFHLYEAFWFKSGDDGKAHLGIGIGTLLLAIDTVALTLYVASCHSFRHLMGGFVNRFSADSGSRSRYDLWKTITGLNEHHGRYFWLSLGSIWLADLYIRIVASGAIKDLVIHL